MLSELVGALKPILATMLIGSAAVAVVAPAFDMASSQRAAESRAAHGPDATPQPDEDDADAEEPMPDFKVLLGECLDTRDPDSDACAAGSAMSGVNAGYVACSAWPSRAATLMPAPSLPVFGSERPPVARMTFFACRVP